MSTEKCYRLFLRKVKDNVHYFGDHTNLLGVRQILSKNIDLHKRLFWLLVLACTSYSAAFVFTESWKLFKADAISYTVETSFLDWDTAFPAVTLCENMDTDRIHSYLHHHNMPLSMAAFYKEVNFWNSKFCNICSSCKLNQSCSEDIPRIVREFRFECSQMLTDCWWGNLRFSCCEMFHPLQTEYGICYSFNSMLSTNRSQVLMLNRRTGLKSLIFTLTQHASIRIHSPYETLSVASENLLGRQALLPLVSDLEVFLKVEETTSDHSVRSLPPSARGCLLWWEKPSQANKWNVKRYSYSACLLYCRSVAQADRCNCTHHFLPQLEGVPSCNINGLACLSKSKDLNSVECDCPMACEETLYKLVHIFNSRHTGELAAELQQRGTRGRVLLSDLPTLRVRRHAIRDTLTLVVDIGGVGGVFFGASVLSVVEVVYLMCIRRPS